MRTRARARAAAREGLSKGSPAPRWAASRFTLIEDDLEDLREVVGGSVKDVARGDTADVQDGVEGQVEEEVGALTRDLSTQSADVVGGGGETVDR